VRAWHAGAIVLLALAMRAAAGAPAAAGALAAAALLAFGARAFTPVTGLIAGGLLAVGPYFVHGADGLFAALAVVHLWAAWRFGLSGTWRDALLWGAAGAAAILAHRYGACAVFAAAVYLLVRDRRWGLVGAGAAVAFAALLVPADPAAAWGPQPGRPHFFARFAIGTGLGLVVFLAAAIAGYARQRGEPRPLRLAFGLALATSLGAALVAWPFQRHGEWVPEQLAGAAAVALLPVAWAAARWPALLLLALALQQVDAGPWIKEESAAPAIARFLEEHGREGDLVVATEEGVRAGGAAPATLAAVRAHVEAGGRVWFVGPCSQRFDDPEHPLLRWLVEESELAYQWEGVAAEYREPLYVLLFQPRESAP